MNLSLKNTQQTMTSREIADLVESRHDSVKRTIERLVKDGAINQPPLVDGEMSGNRMVEMVYQVGKRDSYVVVAQLSPAFTARLVDRWQELEARLADPLAALPADQRALVALMLDNAAIKAQLTTQADAIKRIEANQVAAVASVQSFTALGYSIYKQMQLSAIELNKLGRKASTISKRKGITVDHVADGRHGRVGSYHVDVLDEALQELMK
jgi:phage regulator Rha-like protein